MNEELKKIIEDAVKAQQESCGCTFQIPEIELEHPANSKFGDLSTNIAMKIGKQQGENPLRIADNLVKQIQSQQLKEIQKVEAVKPGFINFYLSEQFYQSQLKEILSVGRKFADTNLGKGQKVQVEFISANPTGPLTLANGRGGFSGDVLANVFAKCGYSVEREYYVNDGGNQVKVLGETLLYLGKDIDKKPENMYAGDYLMDLLGIYKSDEKFQEWKDAKNPLLYGQKYAKYILNTMIKSSVEKMGINFDNWFSEDEMIKKGEVRDAIEFLKKKGLTKDDEGALWMKTIDFGDDKNRVLVKSDGEKTYFANDIAYHWDKFAKRKFDRVVDLWGADHHGYVRRMEAATEAMGFGGKLDIVIFQLVRLIKNSKEYKMSKRKGTYVTMDELLELIDTKDAADVARFFFVSKSFDTHMDFDLDLAKDTSEKNPVYYVKYASARINGILRNTKLDYSKPNLSLIKEPAEIDLVKKVSELPEIIESVITDKKYPVHKFTYYITEIAEKFHKFYHDCRVISDNEELTKARLALVSATKNTLEIVGEDILGIEMPERM
ncbi:arginine--tRNA ligase [candidate division WS5 bacterium]|uniref:Arginine--tRNA ligase n=1 Tax=candidate division WS5 bacterium TaxID=2093353 RepID=A0A419DAS5_9BACT|nr:MAG: arginine--tRNA ligase [candidate division WS5 bacterium]